MKEINISKMLIAKRKEKCITQDELASYIGVSKASVSKWETAQSYPDITFLPQLAAYFNISIDELIGYSPQMTKEDIKKLYHKLSAAFSSQPFDVVLAECHSIIKKYYSCFPLLLQMSILLINHHMLGNGKENQQATLGEVINLCTRIKSESDDMSLSKQANSLEAACLLMLQRPAEVPTLLDETMQPKHDDDAILANAYLQMGDVPKAKQVLQISIYQHVLSTVGNAPALLYTCLGDNEKFEEIIHRISALVDLFKLDKLSANPVAIFHLSVAQCRMMQNNAEKALDALQKYEEICLHNFFPLKLHGDEFFDSIDSWFADFDLGTGAPRDEKIIKQGMVEGITSNPAFAPLAEHPRFKNIVKNLKQNFGGTHNE